MRSSCLLTSTALLVAACGGGGGGSTTANLSGQIRVPEVAPARLPTVAFSPNQPMLAGEVVVWRNPGVAAEDLAVDGFELIRAGDGPIAVYRALAAAGRSSLQDGAALVDSCEQATCEAAAIMDQRPGVVATSPNYMLQSSREPSDRFYANQWHYPKINLPQAWNLTTGSANVVVAVLDTGIVSSHPDFDPARNVGGYDMISSAQVARDGNGRDANPEDVGDQATPQGSSFHGTHVAGTIGARSDDSGQSSGIAGVDWACRLMHVRVLGRGGGSIDDIAAGILYAAGLPNASGVVPPVRADVINMSLGGPGLNNVLRQACDQAFAAGTLLVAAAGNDNTSDPGSPAAFDSVVSVGAVDLLGARAPYSNFSNTVDIWAPGGDMTTDRNGDGFADGVLSCMATDSGQFLFAFEQGTSMASPHVAGVAALMKAANPALTASQLRDRLVSTANTRPGVGLPNNGRVLDALAAVTAAGGAPPTTPVLVATPAFLDLGITGTTGTSAIANRGAAGAGVVYAGTESPLPPWLLAQPSDTNSGDGVDQDLLTFTVNRSTLANGVYQAPVVLRYTDVGGSPTTFRTVEVNVRIQVGPSSPINDTVFLLLIDPNTLESRFQTDTAVGSSFNWSFRDIAAGDYLLVAGTDRDNDDELGDEGELFGAWPDLDDPKVLSVRGGVNGSDLDFSMQDFETIQSAATRPLPRTFRRLR